ncbi:Rav1p KNAG_0I00440 [Huiozyma naganishii CBS 8797]|uniref:RAVE complex protein Rav1 C-terminal domain-containing protein n=1 Tax=Huiozyma naganishii (strain ATCC MYA-139 / BCRC 22969 / CBS 8797 / KCTC 17520 / NBRC 10181 / NCYC 3082 / Yp74L-3) TaxID=1071383 RepID=J7RAD1_HUIN7|nr:hypothetical protein KNAG_0I00440 [Kazachstania naganishii CBS 8797]CCK71835.1 hypothetical protein KNAG_0I00440 [Kazachstania naganishii CBS 8797]
MSLNFLPGRPNDTQQATCQSYWQKHTIFAYCSGNNLILLSNEFTRLQTIYLETDCTAVDINPRNGFIAIAVADRVYIYKPIHQIMKNPKWARCCSLFHDPSQINCLRWGRDNELAVGSDYLSFWKIKDEFGEYVPILLWNKRQAKPVFYVTVSQNSQLVASFGKYDHTVKLWERISISGEQVIFKLTLLSHSKPVTSVRWKRREIGKQEKSTVLLSETLYTLSEDKLLRIWLVYETEHTQTTIQKWGDIQLTSRQKYCIILDNWIVSNALAAVRDQQQHERLANLLESDPDIVMLGDDKGVFEIIALDSLSACPPRPMVKKQLTTRDLSHPIFVSNPKFIYFSELQPYEDDSMSVSLAIHDMLGVIRHSLINVPNFLDQTLSGDSSADSSIIFHLEHTFTGHNKSIQKLERSSDGEALLTISRFSENCVWIPQELDTASGALLILKNIIKTEVPIKLSVIHEKGNLVICLLENHKLQAWECPPNPMSNGKRSILRGELDVSVGDDTNVYPLLMLNTPEEKHSHERHFAAIVHSDGSIRAFEVSLARGIFEIGSDDLKLIHSVQGDEIHKLSVIDPVHTSYVSNRPLISVITKKGFVTTFRATVDYDEKRVHWNILSELNSGIENASYVKGSSTKKMCIVSSGSKTVTLWDLNRSVLEYEETFEDNIEDIDWTSTELGQSIVSVGFTGYALLYTQLRYDYTNTTPSYLPIEKIDITSHTAHNIGDSIWMKNGIFVVASGNQLYVKDKSLNLKDPFTARSIGSRMILSNDILHLNSVLNGPLPVYHPQFLVQAIYAKKLELVKELLLRLFLELRKIDLESKDVIKELPSDLNIDLSKFSIYRDKNYPIQKFPDPYPIFDNLVAKTLVEQLTKITLPYVTRHQQITLITIVEAMEEIMKNEKIVDHNGIRFLLGVKLFLSHKNVQENLQPRDVSWALHSDNKDLLLSIFDSNITTWDKAREYKIAYWVKEEQLLRKFEEIAKFEFSRNDTKDPARCSVFYMALKKKQVLLSLWKISIGHPEQQKMVKFLSNDFSQPRWRTAALKNAFALMSKHRYIDAACFFLLAGSLKDCVNVLCKQVKDMDLAIATCRVYEGDNGPVLGDLLTKQLLPTAILKGDKWTTSFVYWKLKKQNVAIKALVTAPIDLENNTDIVSRENLINKSFLTEDPALLYLYRHLRTRNVNYLTGSLEIGAQIEYRLILRDVDILRRMGCDYLAVALVRNWKFIVDQERHKELPKSPKNPEISGIPNMMAEPTSSARVRPSLFDMFDSNKGSGSDSTIDVANLTKSVQSNPPNLLATFTSSPKPETPEILFDSFNSTPKESKGSTSNTASHTSSSRNLLDDFLYSAPSTSHSSIKKVIKEETSKIVNNSHESSSPEETKENNQKLEDRGEAQTEEPKPAPKAVSKPRNLLDDFM